MKRNIWKDAWKGYMIGGFGSLIAIQIIKPDLHSAIIIVAVQLSVIMTLYYLAHRYENHN